MFYAKERLQLFTNHGAMVFTIESDDLRIKIYVTLYNHELSEIILMARILI